MVVINRLCASGAHFDITVERDGFRVAADEDTCVWLEKTTLKIGPPPDRKTDLSSGQKNRLIPHTLCLSLVQIALTPDEKCVCLPIRALTREKLQIVVSNRGSVAVEGPRREQKALTLVLAQQSRASVQLKSVDTLNVRLGSLCSLSLNETRIGTSVFTMDEHSKAEGAVLVRQAHFVRAMQATFRGKKEATTTVNLDGAQNSSIEIDGPADFPMAAYLANIARSILGPTQVVILPDLAAVGGEPAPKRRRTEVLAVPACCPETETESPDGLEPESACVVCLVQRRVVHAMPCGHTIYCAGCTRSPEVRKMLSCPVCREPIEALAVRPKTLYP